MPGVLSLYTSLEHLDLTVMMDNKASYDRFICAVHLTSAASLRFDGALNAVLTKILTVVPCPRIHLMLHLCAVYFSGEGAERGCH